MAKAKAEIEDIKKSLDFISSEIAEMSKQQKSMLELMGEMKELKKQSLEKDKKIAALESRVDELEQHSRLNNIIINGIVTKPRSYARAVAVNGEPSDQDLESIEQQVIAFMAG